MSVEIATKEDIRTILREELPALLKGLVGAAAPRELVPAADAAKKLGVSRKTVTRWYDAGQLEGKRNGRKLFVYLDGKAEPPNGIDAAALARMARKARSG